MTSVVSGLEGLQQATASDATAEPKRTLRPRRVWPGTRATVGGLLVAVAALGLYASVRSAGAPPQTSYVVARAAIAPGTTLTADLLGAQRMDLPDSLAAATFSIDQDELVLGAVAVEPIAAGDLVHRSDVDDADRAELAPFEMSFRIDADRAVAGSLRAGDLVDVIATSGLGGDALTETILREVLVLEVRQAGDSSLAGDRQVVTVALDLPGHAERLVHAVDEGTLTLVRSRTS